MAATKITYRTLLNKTAPSLSAIAGLTYPKGVPISHHMDIAENIELINGKDKLFWETRNTILKSLAEKDKNGDAKKIVNDETKQSEFDLTDENRLIFSEKLEELNEKEVKINLKKLKRKNFEKVEGLKPIWLAGLLDILEK